MELSSLLDFFSHGWVDELLIWLVAGAAGLIGVVALVNALDMFFDAEAG